MYRTMPTDAVRLAAPFRRAITALAVAATLHVLEDVAWLVLIARERPIAPAIAFAANIAAAATSLLAAVAAAALARPLAARSRMLALVACISIAAEGACEATMAVGAVVRRVAAWPPLFVVSKLTWALFALGLASVVFALVRDQPMLVWSRATGRLGTTLALSASTLALAAFTMLIGTSDETLGIAADLLLSGVAASAFATVARGLGRELPASRSARDPQPAMEQRALARCGHLGLVASMQFAMIAMNAFDAHAHRPPVHALGAPVMFVAGQVCMAWLLAGGLRGQTAARVVAAAPIVLGAVMLIIFAMGANDPAMAWSGHVLLLPLLVAPLLGADAYDEDGTASHGRVVAVAALVVGLATLLFDDLLLRPTRNGDLTWLGLAVSAGAALVSTIATALICRRIARECSATAQRRSSSARN